VLIGAILIALKACCTDRHYYGASAGNARADARPVAVAVDRERAADRFDAVAQPFEPRAGRLDRSADAVVGDLDAQRAMVQPGAHLDGTGVRVLLRDWPPSSATT
jgi:hypothetical protein